MRVPSLSAAQLAGIHATLFAFYLVLSGASLGVLLAIDLDTDNGKSDENCRLLFGSLAALAALQVLAGLFTLMWGALEWTERGFLLPSGNQNNQKEENFSLRLLVARRPLLTGIASVLTCTWVAIYTLVVLSAVTTWEEDEERKCDDESLIASSQAYLVTWFVVFFLAVCVANNIATCLILERFNRECED
jgi:hypothetical protein